jgi:hypothetical protein
MVWKSAAFFFFLASTANGAVAPIFSHDGKRLALVWNSRPGEQDVAQFFEWLRHPETEKNGRRVKQFRISSDNGIPAAELTCALSKIAPDTGSCTLVLLAEGGAQLDRSKRFGQWKPSSANERSSFSEHFGTGAAGTVWVEDSRGHFSLGSELRDGMEQPFIRYSEANE